MRVVERAEVLAVEGGRARVSVTAPDDAARCGSCPAARGCETSTGRRELEAALPPGMLRQGSGGTGDERPGAGPALSPGDEVTVAIEGPSPVLAAVLLFLVPLAAAFAAGLTAHGITSSPGAGLAAGASATVLVYLLLYLSRSRFRMDVRIIGPAARDASPQTNGADTTDRL